MDQTISNTMKAPRITSVKKAAELARLDIERSEKRKEMLALAELAKSGLAKIAAADLSAKARAAVKKYPGTHNPQAAAPHSRPVRVAHKTVSSLRRGCVGIQCSHFLNDHKY